MCADARQVQQFLIGAFPAAGLGTPTGVGEGIWLTTLDLATGQLSTPSQVATAAAPSFLAKHPASPTVYSVSDEPNGARVISWTAESGRLRETSAVLSGATNLAHLTATDALLIGCHYDDGSVAALPLDPSGLLMGPGALFPHTGSGPVADRQECSHAHSSTLAPDGSAAYVCDLGSDELRRFAIVTEADGRTRTLRDQGVVFAFDPGSGPRHAAFREGGALLDVVTELGARIITLDISTDPMAKVADRPAQISSVGSNMPSHIAESPRGDLVYVSNRQLGTLSIFHIPTPSEGPELIPLGEVPLRGPSPRHFAVIGGAPGIEFIVTADEISGDLQVLRRAPGRLLPQPVEQDEAAAVPSAAFVLPIG